MTLRSLIKIFLDHKTEERLREGLHLQEADIEFTIASFLQYISGEREGKAQSRGETCLMLSRAGGDVIVMWSVPFSLPFIIHLVCLHRPFLHTSVWTKCFHSLKPSLSNLTLTYKICFDQISAKRSMIYMKSGEDLFYQILL